MKKRAEEKITLNVIGKLRVIKSDFFSAKKKLIVSIVG